MDAPHPLGPISFISMQFAAKLLLNNRFLSQAQGLAPAPGQSWIRHYSLVRAVGFKTLFFLSFLIFIVSKHTCAKSDTGRERLIQSHSSARFCFELSGNLN